MSNPSFPQIRLQDVHVSYGKTHALAGASFTIDTGSVGLLGPNGAGKTTLLKTLLGFVAPGSGEVEMFGAKMPASRRQVRHRLGYMPERPITSPKISAVSFLRYCGCLFGMTAVDAMERAHEVLNYVGVGETRYRKMGTYSTGMCQRVKFAQALIHDPQLILLDEPTNGLDPEGRVEMLDLICELVSKKKVTVLLSTHLMPDVAQVCDRVIVLSRGQVVRDGQISDLTTLREGHYEVRVRENKQAFREALLAAGCGCGDRHDGTLLVQTPDFFPVRDLFEIARAQQTQIRHLQPVRQSLEEVFMEAVGKQQTHPPHP
jgi:ABC-2 type transport system ATP-binding protein